jgi:hypothetical protein
MDRFLRGVAEDDIEDRCALSEGNGASQQSGTRTKE